MIKENWRKLQKGTGIRVCIQGDMYTKTNAQKYRPGIVIKSYPNHVKVQLMTTEPSHHDYFTIKIDNQIQYIRPIYFRTMKFEEIVFVWKDFAGEPIVLNKNSTFFTKVQEMEIKENLGLNINIQKFKQQENRITNLEKEMEELKNQLNLSKNIKRSR